MTSLDTSSYWRSMFHGNYGSIISEIKLLVEIHDFFRTPPAFDDPVIGLGGLRRNIAVTFGKEN